MFFLVIMRETDFNSMLDKAFVAFVRFETVYSSNGLAGDYRFLEANKAFQGLFGFENKDVTGKLLGDVLKQLGIPSPLWFLFFRQISEQTANNEFESYLEPVKKWFKIQVFPARNNGFSCLLFDVTSYKNSVEQAENNELKYHRVFDNANDAIFIMANDKFVDCNSKTLEIFGCSREEIIGKEPYLFSPLKQLDGSDSKLKAIELIQCVLNGSSQHFEWLHLRKDGSTFEAEVSLSPIVGQKGEQWLIAIVRDISGRKKTEEALFESENKYRRIFENIQDVLYQTDMDGKITEISPSVRKYGFSRDEMIGKLVTEVYSRPSDRDEMLKILMDKGKVSDFELRLQFKDRREIVVSATSHIMFDTNGKPFGIEGALRDITKRKSAEDALKKSNARNKALLDAIPDLMFVYDSKCRIIDFHADGKELYASPDAFLEKKVDSILPPDLAQLALEKVGLVLSTSQPEYAVYELDVNGERQQYEARFVPCGNNEVLSIVRNITERKRAADSLRESEEKYKKLFDSMPVGFYRSSHDGYFLDANPAFVKMLGYNSFEEIKKLYIPTDIFVESHERDVYPANPEFVDQIEIYRVKRKDGQIVWFEDNARYIKDDTGKILYHEGLCKDITDRKRAEKYLQDIIDKNPLSIQIIDKEGYTLQVNASHTRLFGAIPPPDYSVFNDMQVKNQGFGELLQKAKEGEIVHFPDFYYNVHHLSSGLPDKALWIRMVIFPLLDNYGKPERYVLMHDDITDRKRQEVELAGMNKKLSLSTDALRANNLVLDEARKRAEESDRLKTAFLANMSHEIRTPMNAIIGFSSFLKVFENTKADIDRYVDIIIHSGNHLLNLINDIIDISKIEAGQMKLILSSVNLHAMCNQMFQMFHSQLETEEKSNVQIIKNLPTENIFVQTDETRLKQILINLLSNAVKFTEKGFVEFGFWLKDKEVLFYVKDTGIGIPVQDQEKIFKSFTQANENTEKIYGGTGLGLSIAKACVEMLGGKIWVESEPQKGSVFYFTLEYIKPEICDLVLDLKDISGLSFSGQHVLVVEDDEVNYEYLFEILQPCNLKISRAKTGDGALNLLLSDKSIDLVLMDIRLPGLNGWQVTRKIREQNIAIPVIAQTAYAYQTDKEESIAAGCNAHVVKPINPEELIQLVFKCLQKTDNIL